MFDILLLICDPLYNKMMRTLSNCKESSTSESINWVVRKIERMFR